MTCHMDFCLLQIHSYYFDFDRYYGSLILYLLVSSISCYFFRSSNWFYINSHNLRSPSL